VRAAALLLVLALAGCVAPAAPPAATPRAPGGPHLALADLAVPSAVDVNLSFAVVVEVANDGDAPGVARVTLSWNGTALANATAEVPAGARSPVTMRVTLLEPGNATLVAALAGANATREARTRVRAPDFDDVGFGVQASATCGTGTYTLEVRNTGDGVARGLVAHVTLFAESGEMEQDLDSPPQDLAANATARFHGSLGVAEGCHAPHDHRVLITVQADGVAARRLGANANM
jgi:hypothetical protein